MFDRLNPSSIHPPFARYAHGVVVEAGARMVFCSGQLGIRPDATIPADVEAQAALCFDAIAAILGEAGMGLSDLVRINAYVTGREHLCRLHGGPGSRRDGAPAGLHVDDRVGLRPP